MPADPFGEYCKEVRSESEFLSVKILFLWPLPIICCFFFALVLSQDPLMSFTELTQNLSQSWKNLDKKSREKYENKAETNKQRYNA